MFTFWQNKISVTQQRTCYEQVSSPLLCNHLRDQYHFYLRNTIFDQSELNEGFLFDNNSVCFIAFITINNHDMHIEQNRYEGCKAIVLETHHHNNTIYDIYITFQLPFFCMFLVEQYSVNSSFVYGQIFYANSLMHCNLHVIICQKETI